MRFDETVDLFALKKESDGQGGFYIKKSFDCTVKANVRELPLEDIVKIYGDAPIRIIKVILFTQHRGLKKLRYEGVMYDVKRLYPKGNKTYITAEESSE